MFVGLILIFQLFNKVDVLRNLLITFTDVWNTILGNKKTKKEGMAYQQMLMIFINNDR